ncbi:hypothetical protein M422DRAFT_24847 [Sphaerobolus stellatus SS14]|nr:hypothetical protein M422DRAFT_24847 [Sphaerobolus stellatus SS14]
MPDTPHIPQVNATFKEGPDVFSPKDLVQLSRPDSGVANPTGDLAFISLSKYSFEERKTDKKLQVFPIQPNAASAKFLDLKDGEAFWLDARTLAHVVSADEGKSQEVYAVSVQDDASQGVKFASEPALIGKFPATGLTNFKYSVEASTLVFSAYVWPDTNLNTVKEQDEAYENRGTTALVYDNAYVRHWDTWAGPKRSTLFTVGLKKENDKWVLGDNYLAPLNGTNHNTPVEPFGGTDNFDISSKHIIYTTKDPSVPEAWHTRQNIYLVPLKGGEKPKQLTTGNQGATNSPVFNLQGTKVAWTEMAEDGNESDRAKIVVYDLEKDIRFTLTPTWDRSAGEIKFSPYGESIIFSAGDLARVKLFIIKVPATPSASDGSVSVDDPIALTQNGAIGSLQPLSDGRVLFTKSSLTSPNDVFLLSGLNTPENPLKIEQITRFTEEELKGKDLAAGEDFWSDGADGFKVQSWLIKPKGFDPSSKKKWPVVFLVHGGPQSAWSDQWSTRWNPNVFAQQGYFVIAPNPTGSTTFGQEFTDRISEDWGGRPFVDLKAVWKNALELYPQIDADNAVAAGASWGGFAMNWIQGHPEYEFGFKAFVCHDGVFDSRTNGFATEELYFFNHEFGGPPWTEKGRILTEKYNPANFIQHFSAPHLLIHGSRDYRLPETESLGCFNALQQRGIPSRLVIFPDENHFVLKPENSLKWHMEVFGWFAKYTKQ